MEPCHDCSRSCRSRDLLGLDPIRCQISGRRTVGPGASRKRLDCIRDPDHADCGRQHVLAARRVGRTFDVRQCFRQRAPQAFQAPDRPCTELLQRPVGRSLDQQNYLYGKRALHGREHGDVQCDAAADRYLRCYPLSCDRQHPDGAELDGRGGLSSFSSCFAGLPAVRRSTMLTPAMRRTSMAT